LELNDIEESLYSDEEETRSRNTKRKGGIKLGKRNKVSLKAK